MTLPDFNLQNVYTAFYFTNIQHYSFVVMRLYTVGENCHLWQW